MSEDGSILLGPDDPIPCEITRPGAASPLLLVVDHAGAAVPAALGDLGLAASDFDLHIARDLGAAALALAIGERLEACVIRQPYSRLVIDCNRDPDRPDAILEISDGVAIPGNIGLTAAECAARILEIHTPYHRRIGEALARQPDGGAKSLIVCQHSFTPVMGGVARPWHAGVLHLGDSPASLAMLDLLRAEGDLVVGDNEPYAMDKTDFTAPFHAAAHGCDMLELEVRQDLLADPAGIAAWADRLARLLLAAWSRH